MKRILLLAVMAMLFLTGCVEYGLTVKVNKDGSGEIIEKMLLSNQAMNMAKAMNPGGNTAQFLSKENQQSKAYSFGTGVVFSSFEEIQTDAKQGSKTVYKFDDINKILISENMFNETVEQLSNDDEKEKKDDKDAKFFNFIYDARKKGTLTIINGFSEAINKAKKEIANNDSDEEDYDAKNIDQQLAMAKVFLQGMRFYTKVEFNDIKKSNVPYENNQITLFEIDMDKLLAQPELFKDLMKDGDKEVSNFLNNKKKIDGVTFHNFEMITVDFK